MIFRASRSAARLCSTGRASIAVQITSLNYVRWENSPREWRIKGLQFGACNLLVGANASGKSRAITVISSLAALLCGERKANQCAGHYEATFDHDGKILRYELSIEDVKGISEGLSIDGQLHLERGAGGQGRVWGAKAGQFIDYQIPEMELTVVARNDALQHPFVQPLNDWGRRLYQIQFGTRLGKDRLGVIDPKRPAAGVLNPRDPNQIIGIYRKGQQGFGEKFKDAIKRDMGEVGYLLDDVGTQRPLSVTTQGQTNVIALYVKETGLRETTDQVEMSQGMFRALSTIIQLNFAEMTQRPSCVLIDDIGEGLDFERSCALLKLLSTKAEKSSVQLIMTTNDRFVMNAVPSEAWTALRRVGQAITVHNYANSKARFDEFRMASANNLDSFLCNPGDASHDEA